MGAVLVIALTGIIALNSETYATLTASDSVTNDFASGSVEILIDENGFADKTSWNGSETTKKVEIKNDSKSPALIRIAIVPRWVDENGNPWAGDTSIVNIKFVNIATESNEEGKWMKDSGGYYYYNSIVPTDGKTLPIIESVSVSVPSELSDRYNGKKLIVDVKSEAVLASKDPDGNGGPIYEKTWTDVRDANVKSMLNQLSGIETGN